MIIAVDGAGTSGNSLQETRMMIEESLERGVVRLQLSLGVNPSFCKKTCEDRTPIPGSNDFSRCWISKGLQTCGEHCCCPAGYQYRSSFLLDRCVSC